MAPRKRASSDQLREQAKRNVRPATSKASKAIQKNRPKGSSSSTRTPSSPPPPTTISDESRGESGSEQQDSGTDVDEDHVDEDEHRVKGHHGNHKGTKKPSKDIRVMARTATTPHLRTLAVHGSRPPHKSIKPSPSPFSTPGQKGLSPARHFPSSPSLTERDVTDTEDNSADQTDTTEDFGIVGKEKAVLKIAEELIYMRTLFRNPFPKVVILNTWVVEVWSEAQEVLGAAAQSERSRAKLRRYHSRIRSHYVSEIKRVFLSLLKLDRIGEREKFSDRVQFLLDGDRFLCPEENYEDYQLRFLAPVIVDTIYKKYFEGSKARGRKNREEWIASINGPFVCLTACVLHHLLRCYRTGFYKKPADFNNANSSAQAAYKRFLNAWDNRPPKLNEDILNLIRDKIRKKLRKENESSSSGEEDIEAPEEDILTLEEALKNYQKSKAAGRRRKAANLVETKRSATQIDTESPVSAYLEIVDEKGETETSETTTGEATADAGETTYAGDEDVAMRESAGEGTRPGGRAVEET